MNASSIAHFSGDALGRSVLSILRSARRTAESRLSLKRRSGYRPAGLLELLRLVGLVSAVAVLLNQPEWIEEFRPEEKPAIAVFWDGSASMDTRDVVGRRPRGDTTDQRGREAIAPLTDPSSWNEIEGAVEHRSPVRLAEPVTGPRHRTCNETANLAIAPEKIANLRGGCTWPPTATGMKGRPPGAGRRLPWRHAGRAHLRRAGGEPHPTARRRAA